MSASENTDTITDALTARIKTLLDDIPYAKTLGIQPLSVDEAVTFILPYKPENIGNPALPALHGGGIGGFMEMAAIIQIMFEELKSELTEKDLAQTDVALNRFPKPIGINIDYLRRGKPEDTFARAQIFKKGTRVANVRVRAWQDSFDNPIAALTGHFLISRPSSRPDDKG